MKPLQPIVKIWYDNLAEGKIMGMKCAKCGAIEFPPVPVCNACSHTELEWIEMSGEGTMESFAATVMADSIMAAYGPVINAVVRLQEGPSFISWLMDVPLDQQPELFEKLPIKVKMEIHKRDKYSYPVYRMVE